MARPSYDPESIELGTFGRPHGLRGELLLRSHNLQGGADVLASVQEVVVVARGGGGDLARGEPQPRRYRLLAVRPVNDGWLVRLNGIDSREAAAALTGAAVHVPRAALPALDPGEFFVADVVGCAVHLEDGRLLGTADSLLWNGAQDIIVVKGERGIEHMIPLVPTFVLSVDAPGRRVVVAWEPAEEEADAAPPQDSTDA